MWKHENDNQPKIAAIKGQTHGDSTVVRPRTTWAWCPASNWSESEKNHHFLNLTLLFTPSAVSIRREKNGWKKGGGGGESIYGSWTGLISKDMHQVYHLSSGTKQTRTQRQLRILIKVSALGHIHTFLRGRSAWSAGTVAQRPECQPRLPAPAQGGRQRKKCGVRL